MYAPSAVRVTADQAPTNAFSSNSALRLRALQGITRCNVDALMKSSRKKNQLNLDMISIRRGLMDGLPESTF
jgi:hypothetical protein